MSQPDTAAIKAAEEQKRANAEAKKIADAKAKAETDEKAKADAAKKATRVRVILKDGTLGPQLLKFGDETDDEEYVGLLKTARGRTLVEEVK